jgi:hypothetical protein
VLNPYAGYSNEFIALTNNQELKQDKVVTAHEYFHIYQNAHIVFRDRGDRSKSVYALPRWIEESHAVYFSWILGNENGWIDINNRIRELINSISSFRKRVPGMTILDIESESGTKRVKDYCGELCIGKLQYEYALLATIILAQKTSDDAVFIDFYKNHKDIGWIAAFEKTFNMSVDDFYLELEEFLNKKIDFQIEQLTVSVEESKSVPQSEEYPIVDYNTKLDEVCRGLINNSWNGYLDINKNKFNSKGFMFVVAGVDGRGESGIGRTKENAFNDCIKWQEENNIVGVWELYAEGEEVVWDGHSKPTRTDSKEQPEAEYPTVDYNSNVLELCKRDVEGLWTNEIKEDSFLFVVASENGSCEYGRGNTKYNAFENCTKNQEDNNIV